MQKTENNHSTSFERLEQWLEIQQQKGRQIDPVFRNHLTSAIELKTKNWTPSDTQNTYLKNFEVPQIVLFDILTNRFPLVITAQQVAEDLFIKTARGASSICVIDIGIGRGFQIYRLLEALQEKTEVSEVFVLGIDIFHEAILFTEKELKDRAGRFRFSLKYQMTHSAIEDVSWDHIEAMLPANCQKVIINASLCLHHIQKQSCRSELFKQVNRLSPDIFIVIEPNVDTDNEDYTNRLMNAVEHYSALYEYVSMLPLTSAESNSLKTFFSNDFIDPVVFPDEYRFERQQTAKQWQSLALAGGLTSMDVFEDTINVAVPYMDKKAADRPALTFSFHGTPLLSVMAFKKAQSIDS